MPLVFFRGLQNPYRVSLAGADFRRARAGEKRAARQQLATALTLYHDLGMARWTTSTRDIMERLGGDSAPPLAS